MDLFNIAIAYYAIATPILFLILFGIRRMSKDTARPIEPEFVANLKRNGM